MKLTTCMFLKNEGTTIFRALESCKKFTDEYIIGIDDKCTDNTKEEVLRFFSNPSVKGEWYDFTWQDSFAKARNQGMDKATGEWILVLDGHEFFPDEWTNITEGRKTRPVDVMSRIKDDLHKDGVVVRTPNGEKTSEITECDDIYLNLYQQPFVGQTPNNFFMQPRIYRNGESKLEGYEGEKIRFGRAAHNTIRYTRPELSVQYPEAIIIHDAPEDNRKERSVQRQGMNIKQLKDDLKKKPNDTRALFYLGNTYLEGKKYQEAIKCYEKYFSHITVEHEEVYQAYIHLGLTYKELGDTKEAMKAFSNSIRIDPTRRDAYILVADLHNDEKDYKKAIFSYNTALRIPAPNSRMFSNGGTYTWLPHQQIARAYYDSGDTKLAIAHLRQALKYVDNEGWRTQIKEWSGDVKSVLIVDSIGSFTDDLKDMFISMGMEVLRIKQWDDGMAAWADLIWVEWADRNATMISEDIAPKTILRIHGYEAYLNQNLFGAIPWDKLKNVIFVAEHIKEMIPQCKDYTCIQNGVDVKKFYVKSDKRIAKNIGYAGFMNVKKNPMRLAQYIIDNPEYDFHLRVDWQDPFLKESFGYETRKCKNIIYHARYDDLNDFWNQMQFVISTSDIESFSFNIAEAMACGCSPLIYPWKGAKDIWRKDFIENYKEDKKKIYPMKEMRDYIIENYSLEQFYSKIKEVI